jgi:hypothetical protein
LNFSFPQAADGRFTKIAGPGAYGRVGTFKAHNDSAVALGDFKVDPNAEVERPNHFALIDTESNQVKVVLLPASVSYSWRSLARGPHGEALILGIGSSPGLLSSPGDTMCTSPTPRPSRSISWMSRPTSERLRHA